MNKQGYIRLSTDMRNMRVQARLYRSPEREDVEKQLMKLINTTADLFARDFPEQGRQAFIDACKVLVLEF